MHEASSKGKRVKALRAAIWETMTLDERLKFQPNDPREDAPVSEKIDWDAVILSNYASDLLSSRKWFESAAELSACMSILEPHVLAWWQSLLEWQKKNAPIFREHGFHSTYMMLAGFVIENLCKGFLVQGMTWEERAEVYQTGALPKRLSTHRLFAIVTDTGFDPSEADGEMLGRLESAAVWSGRYPIPRVFRETQKMNLPTGQRVSVNWKGSADVFRTKDLIARIRAHVGAQSTYRIPAFQDKP